MRISEAEIERIRTERSVLEFMPHPRRSGRCFVSLCPLPGHSEKTGSFYLYPDGGYKCFGCGRGGKDVISFAFHYWNLSWPKDFPVALERLGAQSTGHTEKRAFLPPTLATTLSPSRREVLPSLPDATGLAIYKVAAALWRHNLWAPTGRDALDYLRRRGTPDALIRHEGIGFSTNTLAAAARRRGLSLEVAQALGLLTPSGHETFAGRVVLCEWRRIQGEWMPVWATARTCSEGATWDNAPKYLNARGDRLLGGLDRALGAPAVAVVEGSFDRLAVLSLGEQAVFLGSNDPPDAVLGELRRLARRAVLFLIRDQDRAGRRGAWSTIYKLDLPPGARLVLVDLPRGIKDPGELAGHPDGTMLYRAAVRGGRVIDTARVRRLCKRCHDFVQRQRAARRASLAPVGQATAQDGTRETM
jgi:DNA primase